MLKFIFNRRNLIRNLLAFLDLFRAGLFRNGLVDVVDRTRLGRDVSVSNWAPNYECLLGRFLTKITGHRSRAEM